MKTLYNNFKQDPIPTLLLILASLILGGLLVAGIDSYSNRVTMNLEIYTLSNGVISLPIRSEQVPSLTNKQIHIIGLSLDKVKE